MDCLENESVCSVKKENSLGYYRIHTIWKTDGFRVNISSKDCAWSGEMTPENVKSMCSVLKIEPDKYLAECKEALTTDDGKEGYSYSFENGCFTWKKMIDEDSGIKVRMGSVVVQPVNFFETIQNILESSINCKKHLAKQLENVRQETEKQQQRANELQIKIEELISKKNLMETDLYSKFILLLNAKKRKIQELKTLLHEVNIGKDKISNIKTNHLKEILNTYEMETEDEDDNDNDNDERSEIGNIKESKHISKCDLLSEGFPNPEERNVSASKNTVKKTLPSSKADLLDYLYGPGEVHNKYKGNSLILLKNMYRIKLM